MGKGKLPMQKRVADIVMDILVEEGIFDCFAVVGGGAMHLNNALALNDKINKYFNHHEQACAMAADAYARISGRMAAVCVTSGPGATNIVTGVMGAWEDSLPMLVISGQVRYETSVAKTGLPLRYRGVQEFDVQPMAKSMTKYAIMITDPLTIRKELRKAINIALSGRRGPVWIDIPLDIQSAVINIDNLYPDDLPVSLTEISKEECFWIYNELKKAKRPCILGGTGIVSSNTQSEFQKFIEKIQIPVIAGGWCTDVLYTEHPLYYGLSGDIGPRTGNFIVQNADVILVLGNSLSFRQTGFAQDLFAPKAKIIYVDVDKWESQKPGLHIARFIHSDLKAFFTMFSKYNFDIIPNSEWIKYCDTLKIRFSAYESLNTLKMEERVNSYYFWKIWEEMSGENQIIAMGNSRVNAAKIQIGVSKRGQRAITNYLCGSMGYDLPAAIGTAVATGQEVFCITGDGSIMMNLQELQTIRHYNFPIKIIVFSNGGYEAIKQTCKNFFHAKYIGCTPESGISFPDFEKIAYAFGYEYKCCNSNSEVKTNISWILNHNGNLFLEVKQQFDNTLIPKVMSRMNEDGTFETPAIHDMAPFLPKDEMEKLMFEE